MWKIMFFVAFVGVFLQPVNGQNWDIKKMEQCPCSRDIMEAFIASATNKALEVDNGQKLRLRLWQANNDICTARVIDESPKPGKIEIRMAYHGSVHIEKQDEGENVEDHDDEKEQQQRVDVEGQDSNEAIQTQPEYQQGGLDIGQQEGGGNIGQEQATEDIELLQDIDDELLGNMALEKLQQSMTIGQEQAGVDIAQEQSELSNESHLETEGDKDYSVDFSFTVDVNTGNLSASTDTMTGAQRRKREVMPFETVIINIAVKFERNPNSDVGTRNDQIKSLLRKGMGDYWLAMAFCLLDVEQ